MILKSSGNYENINYVGVINVNVLISCRSITMLIAIIPVQVERFKSSKLCKYRGSLSKFLNF